MYWLPKHTVHTELTRNSHGTPSDQIGVHLTPTQASQPCEYRMAKFPVCLPSVPRELHVHGRG